MSNNHLNDKKIFYVDCVLKKLEIIMIQFSVTYVTSGITLGVLILTLNNTKNVKKIPTALVLSKLCNFSTLSYKGLKTVLFGGSSNTLLKLF